MLGHHRPPLLRDGYCTGRITVLRLSAMCQRLLLHATAARLIVLPRISIVQATVAARPGQAAVRARQVPVPPPSKPHDAPHRMMGRLDNRTQAHSAAGQIKLS